MVKMMFNCLIFFMCNCRRFWYAELVTVLLYTLANTRTERLVSRRRRRRTTKHDGTTSGQGNRVNSPVPLRQLASAVASTRFFFKEKKDGSELHGIDCPGSNN